MIRGINSKLLNLDSMAPDDLMQLHDSIRLHPRLSALRLGCTTRQARDLANYAVNKCIAIRLRKDGNINSALGYERICERIYSELPEVLRW
jgi:hypothetical protein